MIKYYQHKAINKQRWDTCIDESAQVQIYALSWYLDIVSPNWGAIILSKEDGQYKAVMPLPEKKKLGFPFLKQPFFCQQLGIFSLNGILTPELVDQFLTLVYSKFSYSIDFAFNFDNGYTRGEDISFETTHVLNLNRPYDEIYTNYSKDRKINLNRGFKRGLTLEESKDISPLIEVFKKYTAHKIYGNVSVSTYRLLRDLFMELESRGYARLFYSYNPLGEIVSGGLFTVYRGKIIYLFNASTPEGKWGNGNTLILNDLIKTHSDSSFVLDFESPDNFLTDINRFYLSFGSEEKRFAVLHYNKLPIWLRVIKECRKRIIQSLRNKSNH